MAIASPTLFFCGVSVKGGRAQRWPSAKTLREFLEGKARNLGDDVTNGRPALATPEHAKHRNEKQGLGRGISRVMSFWISPSR